MTIPAPIGETCAAEVVSAVPRSAVCSARPVNLCRTANLSVLCNSLSREESLVVYRFGDIVAAVSGLAQLVLPRLLLSPSPVAQPDFRTSCPAISRASSLKNRKPVVQSLSVMIRLHVGGGGYRRGLGCCFVGRGVSCVVMAADTGGEVRLPDLQRNQAPQRCERLVGTV